MSDKYINNVQCEECGSSKGVGVYQRDNGEVYGNCFSCGTYISNPDGWEDDPPSNPRRIDMGELNSSSLNKLKSRSISKEACAKYGVKSVLSDGEDTIHFYPHTRNGEVVSHMRREVSSKSFSSIGENKNLEFFGQNVSGSGGKMIIVTEGQCLPADTEVLTPQGWVKLEEYKGQMVLQVHPDMTGSFIRPFAVVDKMFTGNMIDRSNSSGFTEIVTEDHGVARITKDGLIKRRADIFNNIHHKIPRSLSGIDTPRCNSSYKINLMKLMVAFQADGSHRAYDSKDFSFSKDCKIKRLRSILKSLRIDYREYDENKNGQTTFRIYGRTSRTLPNWVWVKSISISTILSLFDNTTLDLFVKEMKYWDGNVVKNRNQDEYNNTDKDTIDAVQLAAHLSGYCSTIRRKPNESSNFYRETNKQRYIASILYGKSTSSITTTPRVYPVKDLRVMCLQVPTGFFLMRQNESISVTGNCDALATYDMLKRVGKNYRCVSVVNGASSAVKCFKENYEWVNSFESIFLTFDQDDPGQTAASKISEMFPPNKVKNVVFSEKDANDMLRKDKHNEFLGAIFNAKESKPEDIVSIEDIYDEALLPPEEGLSFPWGTLTEYTYGFRRGELHGVTGATASGKTEFFKELSDHIMTTHGLPVGLFFLEEHVVKTAKVMAGKKMNKRFHIPDKDGKDWSVDELKEGLDSLKGKLYLYQHYGSKDWASIESKIRYMNIAFGVKDFFVDNLTCLVAAETDEYKALNTIMAEMSALTQDLGITIFYISHLKKATGTAHTEGGKVCIDDMRGSGAIGFWSNFVYAVERNQVAEDPDERNTSKLIVLKDRNTGLATGQFSFLKYNHTNGKWEQADDFDDEDFE